MFKGSKKIFYFPEIASTVGMYPSILFYNIAFWISKNKENETCFYDEKYWMFTSAENFSKALPFLSQHQIYSCLNKLINSGYIIRGNYNKIKYDKTSWYALTSKGEELANMTSFEDTCE